MALPKKEIVSPLRMALLMVSILIFAGLLYYLISSYIKVYGQPATIKKPVTIYQYNQSGKIGYSVKLKPNSIFRENILGPGKSYYSKLTDYINLDFSYLFSADQETQLEGNYMVTATLETKGMWQKDFTLVPLNSFGGKEKNIAFKKGYQLRLEPFKEYLKKVNEELGVTGSEPKLVVKMKINLNAAAKAGSFRESLVPAITIPLTDGLYKIDDNLVSKKRDSIKKSVTIADPNRQEKKPRFILTCIATIFAGVLFGFLLLCTKGRPVPPVHEDVLIQKRFGNRLFEVPGGIQLGDNVMVITFNSVDNLVKAADELGKPIMYFNSVNTGLVNYFVFDGQVVYKYISSRVKTPHNLKPAWTLQRIEG